MTLSCWLYFATAKETQILSKHTFGLTKAFEICVKKVSVREQLLLMDN